MDQTTQGAVPMAGPAVAGLYAGFWKRFLASIIDAMILFGAIFIVVVIYILATGSTSHLRESPAFNAWFRVVGIIAGWLYSALLESSAHQATLGKMALGIKVTDMMGNKVSFGRATGRHFAKWISSLIFFIGYIMAGFTEKKQALHDMIAGCLVVNKK